MSLHRKLMNLTERMILEGQRTELVEERHRLWTHATDMDLEELARERVFRGLATTYEETLAHFKEVRERHLRAFQGVRLFIPYKSVLH